jgi:endo-1,3(4)-beta-glucanase
MDDSSGHFHDSKPFRDEPSSELELRSTATPLSQERGTIEYTVEDLEAHSKVSAARKWRARCCSAAPCSCAHRRRRVVLYSSILAAVAVLIVSVTVALSVEKNRTTASTGEKALTGDQGETPSTQAGGSPSKSNSSVFYYTLPDIPLSSLDPVEDLNLYPFKRPAESSPSTRLGALRKNKKNAALPTNSWYQNLLRLGADEVPNRDHKAYTIPYMVDTAGAIPGVRIHGPRLVSTSTQVTLTVDEPYGLTLGAMGATGSTGTNQTGYTVHHATELGITLQWDAFDQSMRSTLVLGMPYVTMIYNTTSPFTVLPTIYSETDLEEAVADEVTAVDCADGSEFRVQQELQLKFLGSGQRWMVFFSRPVEMQCQGGNPTILQVINDSLATRSASSTPLIVRVALVVTGSDPTQDEVSFETDYMDLLRAHADTFPGDSTFVSYSFNSEQSDADRARVTFDWDPRSMQNGGDTISAVADNMLMYALPHHQDLLSATSMVVQHMCTNSMTGPVCLTKGPFWDLDEDLPPVGLRAPRHPDSAHLSVLAEALMEDIGYQIPANFQIGAADTYFSAKTIAKLARILLINEEVKELCSDAPTGDYATACEGIVLPSEDAFDLALDQLRQTMTVWIGNTAQAPFVYDTAWGGVVSCGCLYDGGQCTNQSPDCPAFTDPGLNFGNGFYNDHHFHYGYVLGFTRLLCFLG